MNTNVNTILHMPSSDREMAMAAGMEILPATVSIETEVVRFKDQDKKDDDCELDDLMDKRNGLSLRERSYAALYAWLAHRFPNVAVYLPKPKPEVVS
jgi:hypothetical protein